MGRNGEAYSGWPSLNLVVRIIKENKRNDKNKLIIAYQVMANGALTEMFRLKVYNTRNYLIMRIVSDEISAMTNRGQLPSKTRWKVVQLQDGDCVSFTHNGFLGFTSVKKQQAYEARLANLPSTANNAIRSLVNPPKAKSKTIRTALLEAEIIKNPDYKFVNEDPPVVPVAATRNIPANAVALPNKRKREVVINKKITHPKKRKLSQKDIPVYFSDSDAEDSDSKKSSTKVPSIKKPATKKQPETDEETETDEDPLPRRNLKPRTCKVQKKYFSDNESCGDESN